MSRIEAVIRSRRTIHDFRSEPVPKEVLLSGLETACWAPNHHHVEPWRFYLPGPRTQAAICCLNAELVSARKGPVAGEKKLQRWQSMPGWLVVTSLRASDPVRDQENYAASCCAVQNLALYLWEQGIGLKWATGDVIRDPGFLELLGASDAMEQVVGLFWYGYPAVVPAMTRKPLAERLSELP